MKTANSISKIRRQTNCHFVYQKQRSWITCCKKGGKWLNKPWPCTFLTSSAHRQRGRTRMYWAGERSKSGVALAWTQHTQHSTGSNLSGAVPRVEWCNNLGRSTSLPRTAGPQSAGCPQSPFHAKVQVCRWLTGTNRALSKEHVHVCQTSMLLSYISLSCTCLNIVYHVSI